MTAQITVTDETVKAIDAGQEIMRVAFEKGDADLLMSDFYTADGWVLGGGDQTWHGTEGLLSLYEPLVGKYTWSTKREALIALGEDGALELLVGTITPVDPAEETLDYKIQFSWVRKDGKWLCATQFFDFGKDFKPAEAH